MMVIVLSVAAPSNVSVAFAVMVPGRRNEQSVRMAVLNLNPLESVYRIAHETRLRMGPAC